MKKLLSAILAVAVVSFQWVGVSYGEGNSFLYGENDEDAVLIVQLEGDPALVSNGSNLMSLDESGTYAEKTGNLLRTQENVAKNIIKEVNSDVEVEYSYTGIFNGFAISAKKGDINKIKSIPGVADVEVSAVYSIPKPMLTTAGELADTKYSYDTMGYSGEGQLIGVIDIGLQKDHPFFSTAPANPKITKEYVSELINNGSLSVSPKSVEELYYSDKIPYAYNYYSKSSNTLITGQSHGTHVAGIAVGKNGKYADGTSFSGIAPEAQLAFFSIGSESGGILSAAVIAALDDAAKIGVDVVNLSLGSDFANGKSTAEETSYNNARNTGMIISVASGNSSKATSNDSKTNPQNIDYSTLGSPACYSAVTAVASCDNNGYEYETYQIAISSGAEIDLVKSVESSTFYEKFLNKTMETVFCGYGSAAEYTNVNLTGKIAVVERGNDILFTEKAQNAKNKGAVGIIIINNVLGNLMTTDLCLPSAGAYKSDKEALVATSSILVKSAGSHRAEVKTAGLPSSYSSWGVENINALKPEIMAPGGNIYSSVPGSQYGYKSGTSMATPFMSGIYGLMCQYYDTNPFIEDKNNLSGGVRTTLIENLLMSSAVVTFDDNELPFSPRLQGSGEVNIEKAIKAPVVISGTNGKANIALGENVGDNFKLRLSLKNIKNAPVTYDKITIYTTTDNVVGNSVTGTKELARDSVDMPSVVTIAPGEEYGFLADVTLNAAQLSENSKIFTNGFYIDGYVVFEDSTGENVTESAPFFGFYGDWDSAPIFDSTIYDDGGGTLGNVEIKNNLVYIEGTGLMAENSKNGHFSVLGADINFKNPDSEYISFSYGASRLYNELYLFLKNYRHASKVRVVIKDKNNKKYFDASTYPKSSFVTNVINVRTSNLPDGEYDMTVYGTLRGSDDVEDDSFTLPITIDSEQPKILKTKYDSTTKTINLTATDNKYLKEVYVHYIDESGVTRYIDYGVDNENEQNEVTKAFTLPIEPKALQNVYVGCTDYAGNDLEMSLYDALLDAFVRPQNIETAASYMKLSIEARNNTTNPVLSKIGVAFFREDGSLLDLTLKDESLGEYEYDIFSAIYSGDPADVASFKLMMWDNFDKMSPINESKLYIFSQQ